MTRCFKSPYSMLFVGLGAGLLVGVGMMIGTMFAMSQATGPASTQRLSENQIVFPEKALLASATHGSEKFAMATGQVSDDSEGVFFLDYLTGELQCWVVYARTGKFGGLFKGNVLRDLKSGRGKEPKFLMVTG